jgi:hypothetical protein
MRIDHKLGGIILLSILAFSSVGALQNFSSLPNDPAGLSLLSTPQAGFELEADVVTAADAAGGGHFTTSDILFVVIIVFAVIGLIAVL